MILGALGYIEKIFHFKLSRKVLVILLVIFILISVGEFIFSNFDLRILEKKLEAEKTTIRDFEARVLVKFSGNWYGGVRTVPYYEDVNYLTLIGKDSRKENIEIKLFTTKPFILRDIDENHGLFESFQTVHKGDYPHGKSIKELSNINKINIGIPFTNQKFKTNKLIIDYLKFEFFINGESFDKYRGICPFEADIISKNGNSWISIGLEIGDNNFYDYSKL